MNSMTKLTENFIDEVNARMWREATAEFGDNLKVPFSRQLEIGDYVRALYVLQFHWLKDENTKDALNILKHYSISDNSIDKLLKDGVLDREVVNSNKAAPRKVRLRNFEAWSKDHRGEEFTVDFLIEKSEFSRPTLMNYLKTSRLFEKVKRGTYKIVEAGV